MVFPTRRMLHERVHLAREERGQRVPVELRPAYVWDCPECGREVFCRGLVPEMSAEATEELQAEHGIQPWDEGDFVMMPTEVVCPHCGNSFETVHFSDEEP